MSSDNILTGNQGNLEDGQDGSSGRVHRRRFTPNILAKNRREAAKEREPTSKESELTKKAKSKALLDSIDDLMLHSILVTIFFNVFLGIIAIYHSLQANSAKGNKDIPKARLNARLAQLYIKFALIAGVFTYIAISFYLYMLFFGGKT